MPAERTAEVGGRATRVLSAGPARSQTIVWLHDTLGNRWTEGHERLSSTHRVVAPSMPGVEDSTTLDGIDSAEDVVFWLLDLLTELRPTESNLTEERRTTPTEPTVSAPQSTHRPVLLGCGLGGWMAAEFAVRYPERIGGLVLVDAYGLRVEGALAEDEFALTAPMLRPLLFAEPDGELARDALPDTQLPERLEGSLHARVAAARLAWQFPYDRKLRDRLRRANVPALVVWGENDRLVRPEHGRAYTAALPDARLVMIPDAGHYPYLESPAAFADAVQAFVSRR